MQLYTILTIIISVCAVFAYVNAKFIKLPPAIGIMVLSLLFSLILITIGRFDPSFTATIVKAVVSIDFHSLLMNIMLSFLLFAGSIHINAASLKKEFWPVAILSTIGMLISTALVGVLVYFLFNLFGVNIPLLYCFLFGSLISPTDPVAVLAILKHAGIPYSLQIKISGESLFNDGVAVAIFLTLLEVAQQGGGHFSYVDATILFAKGAGGGLLFGYVLGYVCFWLMRSINNYQVEVFITVALVMGGYSLAQQLHISGPLAMIVAGIITGNTTKQYAMRADTREHLDKFWELIDEMMNAVLFLLIGLEVLVIPTSGSLIIIGIITILIVLFARWLSVALPISFLRYKIKFEKHAIAMLTWAGLRGGLSVAMALSLPANMFRDQFVAITYIVVVFSIVVQGLTIKKFMKWLKVTG